MKKILALALALMLCLCSVAFADATATTPKHMTYVTISKTYNATDSTNKSPAETFTFTVEDGAKIGSDDTVTYVTDSTVENADGKIPQITNDMITSAVYAEGDAGNANKTKTITVTLPTYSVVGIYYYTINEVVGTTAGVTYHDDPIVLKVTVLQQENGQIYVAAVHAENPYSTETGKTNEITNLYSAGDLKVSKTVAGILGDRTKYFTVKVQLTGDTSKTYQTIAVTGGHASNPTTITVNAEQPTSFQVKHGDTLHFENIPYGVTYTVVEDDYTADGYKDAAYDYDADKDANDETALKIDDNLDKVAITNTKEGYVDTGIALDNAPYMIVLALVVVAGVMMMKKRSYNA